MLILFDIDMTLLESQRIGVRCLRDAGRSLFSTEFSVDGIQFGGGLDPNIIRDMLEKNGIDSNLGNVQAMRTAYHQLLSALSDVRPISTALPGAHELVQAMAAHVTRPTLGLLTGNFPETGTLKIESAGFDPALFTVNAWGDSSPHANPVRSHLPPVAMETYRRFKGIAVDPQSVVVIGDTVHDVTCALDTGCRSLAVATGHDSRSTLESVGAHCVIDDLTQTGEIVKWIMDE